MVLKHMVTDTDSIKGAPAQPAREAKQPEAEVEQPVKEVASHLLRQIFEPLWITSPPRRNLKLWFLLTIITFFGVVAYYLWMNDLIFPALDTLHHDKVVVTAIVYDDKKGSAVISGRVVHEGDVVNRYKIVKIHKDTVELEKNGRRLTKQVYK